MADKESVKVIGGVISSNRPAGLPLCVVQLFAYENFMLGLHIVGFNSFGNTRTVCHHADQRKPINGAGTNGFSSSGARGKSSGMAKGKL